jgi:hypothetical protein
MSAFHNLDAWYLKLIALLVERARSTHVRACRLGSTKSPRRLWWFGRLLARLFDAVWAEQPVCNTVGCTKEHSQLKTPTGTCLVGHGRGVAC